MTGNKVGGRQEERLLVTGERVGNKGRWPAGGFMVLRFLGYGGKRLEVQGGEVG